MAWNVGEKQKRDESITQVDVRKLELEKGVAEISKYSAKDSDYLITQDVFDVMYKALKGRQIITYNGYLKNQQSCIKGRFRLFERCRFNWICL